MEHIKTVSENITVIYTLLGLIGLLIIILILKPSKKLILLPELVPYSMHGKNVRAVLSSEDWKTLAKVSYKEANHRCEICGAKGQLECHEIWKFDDRRLIQSLVGLITLCPDCHRVKHIGLARKMGWYGDALEHMARVNGVSKSRARKFIDYAETEVKSRKDEYDLDLTYLNNYRKILPRKFGKRENENCVSIKGNW